MDEQQASDGDRHSVELSADDARFVADMVARGAFATPADVVNAGLDALRERDDEIERWLREEVVPTYDRAIADPNSLLSIDDVREGLEARHQERLRAEKR